MSEYEGIEYVDPVERQKQRALTEVLWLQLEKRIGLGTPARIEAYLVCETESDARGYLSLFDSDWETEWHRDNEEPPRYRLKLLSPMIRLSREALLDLVDILLIDAAGSTCKLDGFQVSSRAVRRPWWKFW